MKMRGAMILLFFTLPLLFPSLLCFGEDVIEVREGEEVSLIVRLKNPYEEGMEVRVYLEGIPRWMRSEEKRVRVEGRSSAEVPVRVEIGRGESWEGEVKVVVVSSDGYRWERKVRVLVKAVPREFRVYQNYPNPFNPETWIPYQLPERSRVVVRIYDMMGRLVRVMDLGWKEAGYYLDRSRAVYWDGRNELGEEVASGVYFYQVQAGRFSEVRRMVIMR